MLDISKSKCLIPVALALAMLSLSLPLAKAAMINVGSCFLAPDEAEQTVRITVYGGEQVSGLNFCAQIGDGGLSGNNAPIITAVDLKTATIFDSIPDSQTDDGSMDQVVFYSIEIQQAGGSVPAQGVLATLTMDSTGYSEGTWDFLLADVLGDPLNDTNFAGTPISIQNGTIGITIDGDCTLDGRVDEADATVVAANWGVTSGAGWTEGDLNGDGAVNNSDAMVIAGNWLQEASSAAAVAVPEPTTAVLFVSFLLAWIASLRLGREILQPSSGN